VTEQPTAGVSPAVGQGKRAVEILEEKKRLLSLICSADRMEFEQTVNRSMADPKVQLATHLVAYADVIADFIPGRIGVLARRASTFARIGRQLGFLW
jgi:hypothetical protein